MKKCDERNRSKIRQVLLTLGAILQITSFLIAELNEQHLRPCVVLLCSLVDGDSLIDCDVSLDIDE